MKPTDKPKIAIIGARGIGNYGGFESVVSELGPGLVKRGYTVYCSCEKSESEEETSEYLEVKKIYFPIKPPSNYTLRKAFEIFYDIYFTIKCSFFCDIVYALGLGASISLLVPRLLGKVSIVNVDGLEWRRSKFSLIEKFLLKIMFLMCCISSNVIIIDNNSLIEYVNKKYRKKAVFIPYGVNTPIFIPWDESRLTNLTTLKNKCNLLPNKYWLVVARLEPENNIHIIIEGFIKSKTSMPLVIIGEFTSDSYKRKVHNMISNSSNNVLFLGSIYNIDILNMFRQNCFAYIHGHSVGGTNPSLLEAMAMKNIIVAHDNQFNREVGSEVILYFKGSFDLKDCIESIEDNYSTYLSFESDAYERVLTHYSWEEVTIKYNTLFKNGFSGLFAKYRKQMNDSPLSLEKANVSIFSESINNVASIPQNDEEDV